MENTTQSATATEKKKSSVLAIIGLVLGILALLTSLIPIVNNLSFVVAVPGVVLAIIGLVSCIRGTRSNKGVAIAAVIVNAIAIVAVLGSQSLYGAAIDKATQGPQVVATDDDKASDDDGTSKSEETPDESKEYAVGSSVELENGLVVSVDEIESGLTASYSDGIYTRVRVTYTNNGDETVDFNPYDWKSENADGVQSDVAFYSDQQDELSSGSLSAGGTVSGNIYFEGDITQMHYFANVFLSDEPTATWKLS